MRLKLPGLCLMGCLFAGPAMAGPIGINVTSLNMSRPVNQATGATIALAGDDFVLAAALFGALGLFSPTSPYIPGTQIAVRAGWSGIDAPGSLTYKGQTFSFGGFDDPGALTINFNSDSFIVPPLDSPVVTVPFSLTGTVNHLPTAADVFNLSGTGTMTFTFTGGIPSVPPSNQPVWFGGAALFTIEPAIVTPEPSAFILLGTGLSGLVVAARRRVRARRSASR